MLAIYTENFPNIAPVRPGKRCTQDSSHEVLKPVFANIACLQIVDSQKNTNIDCSQGGRDMHAQA